jgi:hypothetical protein
VEVSEKVPEQAKTALEKAIEASRKGSEIAVQSVTGTKKDELLQKIEEIRIEIEKVPLPAKEEIPPEEELPEEKPIEEKEPELIKPEVTCQDECSSSGLRKCSNNGYRTCGNYDEDNCLEWSSITDCPPNTICQKGNCIQQKCRDGTPYSQCSSNKPLYCDNGSLINKCSLCGCPLNQECQIDGSCCRNECSQVGLKGCTNNGYQTCGNYDTDPCLEWSSMVSCPAETTCVRGNCIAINLPKPEVEYWAVLVEPSVDKPIGAINASILLKNTLLHHRGWQKDHIKYLIGEDATYANFMAALDWLAINSDSNDTVLILISSHGNPTGLALTDTQLNYSDPELSKKLNKISYDGLGIMIHACMADNAIPYLQKENRIVLILPDFSDLLLQALELGDLEGNNDNWVSVEEIFNFMRLSDPSIPNDLIKDNYVGELNIVFLDSYLRHLDQYNIIPKDSLGGLQVGARMENEISWLAQSFKPSYPILTKVMLHLYREGHPGPLTVSIRKDLSGPDLTLVILPQDMFYHEENFMCPELYEFDFPDIQVIPGETYYIVIGAPSAAWEGYTSRNNYAISHGLNHYSKGKLFTFYNPRSWGPAETWSPIENDPYFATYPVERDLFFATFGKPQ